MKDKKERERQLGQLLDWVSEELGRGRVPRLSDLMGYAAREGFRGLPRAAVARALRLFPAYRTNSAQQRERLRSRKYRVIAGNSLGHLHADIGFFARSDEYETPKTYRAGFLVAKDVLSRYTYGVILRGNRKAESMVSAFEELLEHHRKVFGDGGHGVKSVSFDQERSVVSHTLQNFLTKNNISFHAFAHSSSKAKHAESAIRLVRNTLRRLQLSGKEKRWWHLLAPAIAALNERPIVIRQRTLRWRPLDVRLDTLPLFLADLYKTHPLQYHAQFPVNPALVDFAFSPGDYVQTKTIVTSSQVLGQKRSEVSLDKDVYEVLENLSYLTAARTVGKAYRVIHVVTRQEETFDENDLAETVPPGTRPEGSADTFSQKSHAGVERV